MSFQILGLATALPRHSIEQTAAMELAKEFSTRTEEQRRLLTVLYRRTGVKHRHSVLLETPSKVADCSPRNSANRIPHPPGSDLGLATMLASHATLGEEAVSQSFYPDKKHK